MKMQRYIPIIVVIIVLIAAQAYLRTAPTPEGSEMLPSQVGNTGNSLHDIALFDLEIATRDDGEIKMRYVTNPQTSPTATVRGSHGSNNVSAEKATEEITQLVGSIPPLTIDEPLTLIQSILDQLEVGQKDLREFELEYRLIEGTEREIELDIEERNEEAKD